MKEKKSNLINNTVAPFYLALGLTLIFLGILTQGLMGVLGLSLVMISLYQWIGEMRNEQQK